jgi:hypothetical protein
MMDYQKNIHADTVVREVIGIEPTFLALFGVEALLKVEGARKSMLQILKLYIERRDHFARIEHIVEELFESASLRQDLINKLKGQKTEDSNSIVKSEALNRTSGSFVSSRKTLNKVESNDSVSSFINSTKRNKNQTSSD